MSRSDLPPKAYAGYDVLDKWDTPSWDDFTREVVRKRLKEVPPRRFFSEHEWATLEAICDRLVPQPDRVAEPVPIVPWIDRKLDCHIGEGYRYHDMPPMEEAWRRGLKGIDEESRRRFGRPFLELEGKAQDEVLTAIQNGEVDGPAWSGLPPKRFFGSTLLKEVVGTYYAHPAAWSEIGFGGPASPRGYARLGPDAVDPWEAKERQPPEDRR